MISRGPLDRRGFVSSVGAALALPMLMGRSIGAALAQQPGPSAAVSANPWRELGAIAAEADRLGLSVPRMSAGVQGGVDFNEVMPAVADFMESIEASAPASRAPAADIERLLAQVSDLLIREHQKERSPHAPDKDAQPGAQAIPRPSFESLREEYTQRFRDCKIRDEYRSQVNWYVGKLRDDSGREQYNKVAEEVCAPWYFVGIIHAMEASFNFRAHLHNGDPLSRRTVQVPRGLPKEWIPPDDWVSSASDAIRHDKFADEPDWSLPRMLYRWEAYNGFRSRVLHNIKTPYLWSFSNHYDKGKFVADNVWDANATSKQCGAAVMLKALVEGGIIAPPT